MGLLSPKKLTKKNGSPKRSKKSKKSLEKVNLPCGECQSEYCNKYSVSELLDVTFYRLNR